MRELKYVVLSYIVFGLMVLGLCGTASMVFHCSPVIMRILSNICAWTPTIVLLIGFKYFCPNRTIVDFYKKAFGTRINIVSLVVSAIITFGATLITVYILPLLQGKVFDEYWSLGSYPFWASFIFSLTTGPTGEESGWCSCSVLFDTHSKWTEKEAFEQTWS